MTKHINTSRIAQLSLPECEEILYAFDKCLMIGLSAPEEEIRCVVQMLRMRVDELAAAAC
jgi:hypothetical protein